MGSNCYLCKPNSCGLYSACGSLAASGILIRVVFKGWGSAIATTLTFEDGWHCHNQIKLLSDAAE